MDWIRRLWQRPQRPQGKRALALAGVGVTGGMFEIGCLAALDQTLPDFRANDFDLYIGTSSGSLVAGLLANGVRPEELSHTISNGLLDPYNLTQQDVLGRNIRRRVIVRAAKIIKTITKHLLKGFGPSLQDFIVRVQQDLPPGLFTLDQLEQFLRGMFETKGLANRFDELPRALYITAVDLNRAERVVFGEGWSQDVPISQAIAASSAIPGFFEPYRIAGRDYIDGGVGQAAHADIAIAKGADLVVVVNPIVPAVGSDNGSSANGKNGAGRLRGLKYVLEQSARITAHNLLEAGLRQLEAEDPGIDILLVEPSPRESLLFSNSTMSFEYSREAVQYGFTSTMELLKTKHDVYSKVLSRHSPRPSLRAVASK